MTEWCKIVVVDDQQVLFWIDWSSEGADDQVALHQQATNGRVQIDRKLTFTIKPDAPDAELIEFQRKVMDLCDEKMARHVLTTVEEFTP